jgi:hypothetical protein
MLVIGVENHDRTRLLVQAHTINERAETFQWIFEAIIKNVWQYPLGVFTDADTAIDSSLAEVFHLRLVSIVHSICSSTSAKVLHVCEVTWMTSRWTLDPFKMLFEYRWHHFMDKWQNRIEKTAKDIECVENYLYGSRERLSQFLETINHRSSSPNTVNIYWPTLHYQKYSI